MIDATCQTFVSDCHVRAATDLVSHTWDPVVLSALRLEGIAGISDKVLTESLRRLQERRLIAKDQPASSDRAV